MPATPSPDISPKRVHRPRESARVCAETAPTEAEIKFLATHRVELNAFASDALVQWITSKLEQHGVRKVIPEDEVLAEGYRRQYQSAYLGQHFGELLERSSVHINSIDIPSDLRERVACRLQERPSLSWDDAVAETARMRTWPDSNWHSDKPDAADFDWRSGLHRQRQRQPQAWIKSADWQKNAENPNRSNASRIRDR